MAVAPQIQPVVLARSKPLPDTTADHASLLSWPYALGGLILVIWLIPIKTYRLPVHLPFNLEIYRVLVVLLAFAFLVALVLGRNRLDPAGQGKPLMLLSLTAIGSLAINVDAIQAAGLQTQALKSLSFFLGFMVVYLLVSSTTRGLEAADKLVVALVVGCAVVAVGALYEARSHYNVFSHLESWIPILDYEGREENKRAGILRVRASAQHPIALGVALILCVPLALYLARRAASRLRFGLWIMTALVILAASYSTISRTVVIMTLAMTIAALWVRRKAVARAWPLLLVLPFVLHAVAPGAVKTLYRSFTPSGGLLAQQQQRAGVGGSGRLADVGPGFDLWERTPVLGSGLGTASTRGDDLVLSPRSSVPTVSDPLFFDNQYMVTLVTLGAVGLVGVLWFLGAALTLGRTARRRAGPAADLVAACSVCTVGFAVAMFLFDAFAFVQATLVFFVIVAIGMSVRKTADASEPA